VEQNASEIESLISKYPRKLKGEGALDPKKPEDERREGWKDNGFVLVEERNASTARPDVAIIDWQGASEMNRALKKQNGIPEGHPREYFTNIKSHKAD